MATHQVLPYLTSHLFLIWAHFACDVSGVLNVLKCDAPVVASVPKPSSTLFTLCYAGLAAYQ